MEPSNLSESQLRLWSGYQARASIPMDNMVLLSRIQGMINKSAFESAFIQLVATTECLQTVFSSVDGVPRQDRDETLAAELECLDFRTEADPESVLSQWVSERRHRLFDVGERLFDAVLIQVEESQFVFYLNQHHLITDATSCQYLLETLSQYYQQALAGDAMTAESVASYADFVAAEDAARQSVAYQKAAAYFQERASLPHRDYTYYGNQSPGSSAESHRIYCRLGVARTERLRQLATEQPYRSLSPDLSMYQILNTLYVAFLSRITDETLVQLSVTSRNRVELRFRKALGCLVELLPLELELEEEETFRTLHEKIRLASVKMLSWAVPGCSRLAAKRTPSAVLNYITAKFPPFAGMETETEWVHSGFMDPAHSVRLEVFDFDASSEIRLAFDLNDEIFPEAIRQVLPEHFLRTVDAFLADSDTAVAGYEIATAQERVGRWCQRTAFQPGETIVSRFQRAVALGAAEPAVTAQGVSLSYTELDQAATAVAAWLGNQGIGSGAVVALCVPRSVEAIVGMIGILRAGAAYLPLDPKDPKARLQALAQDAEVRAVLYGAEFTEVEAVFRELPLFCLSADSKVPSDFVAPIVSPSDLAYVLFTSGSTGQPKAVQIEHQSVVSLVDDLGEGIYSQYETEGGQLRVAVLAPFVFDASVQQIFAALLRGHHLQIVDDEIKKDGRRLWSFFAESGTDVTDGTPGHLQLLVNAGDGQTLAPTVRHLVIGGEALPSSLVARFFACFAETHPRVTNVYGVAECGVDSLAYDLDAGHSVCSPSVPIGRALGGAEAYILNAAGRHQPFGVMGELVLGGRGVGRGYLGQPELTAARFGADPFVESGRSYQTGDQVRLLPDHSVEFCGRADLQVKIRGHRIELGEIESRLMNFRETYAPVSGSPEVVVNPPARCRVCLLTERHPGVGLDEAGVCSVCRQFESHRAVADRFFQPMSAFRPLVDKVRAKRQGEHDCLLLYSGGKDSSYVLYRLVEMGLKVLAFTFDNGHISGAAFANIRRQTEKLGVESIVLSTPDMDAIFLESLEQDQTVCTGCFKALTTISTRLAQERDIGVIVTGLSRGQIYDTKLSGLIAEGVHDVEDIEAKLKLFRQAYHANRDRTARLLGDDLSDVPLDEFQFVDFFRYDDTPTPEIREYLKTQDSFWSQPQDTGFCSSNCLMNDVGICVHSQERGYHNYEAPLSWDIRLGLLRRDAALGEVAPVADVRHVNLVLKRIGFLERRLSEVVVLDHEDDHGHRYLCAYYVASHTFEVSALREFLAQTLPDYMIPARFFRVDGIPRTANGKVDRAGLAPDEHRPGLAVEFAPPSTPAECLLAEAWRHVLGLEAVGVHDNYFELGGDSIMGIQIASVAADLGGRFEPHAMFQHKTIAELAPHVVLDSEQVESEDRDVLPGEVPFTPILKWYFEREESAPFWGQSVMVSLPPGTDEARTKTALERLVQECDALRIRYRRTAAEWRGELESGTGEFYFAAGDAEQFEHLKESALDGLKLEAGCLLAGVYLNSAGSESQARPKLWLLIHHLAVDALSWPMLLTALEAGLAERPDGLSLRRRQGRSFVAWARNVAEQGGELLSSLNLDVWAKMTAGAGRWLEGWEIGEPMSGRREIVQTLSVSSLGFRGRAVRGTQLRDLVLAAIARCVMAQAKRTSVLVELEGHGRELMPGSASVVGWLTARFPFEIQDQGDLKATQEWVHRRFEALPLGGAAYGLARQLDADVLPSAEAMGCDLGFNYLGVVEDVLPAGSALGLVQRLEWVRAAEDVGGNPIEVDAMVEGDRLRLRWSFDAAAIETSRIETLTADVEQALMIKSSSADKASSGPAAQVANSQLLRALGKHRRGR